jgi:hypothetical protein
MPKDTTVRVKIGIQAAHAALQVPEMKAWLAKLEGKQREEFLDVVSLAAAAVLESVWDTAHYEGHGCRSPFCRPNKDVQ